MWYNKPNFKEGTAVRHLIDFGDLSRQEWDQRTLEAEVAALERLAAMRGDLSGGMRPEG